MCNKRNDDNKCDNTGSYHEIFHYKKIVFWLMVHELVFTIFFNFFIFFSHLLFRSEECCIEQTVLSVLLPLPLNTNLSHFSQTIQTHT